MSWQDDREMTKEEYSAIIHRLGMNKSQAGRYLGVSLRTAQRYWDGLSTVPTASALLLRALVHYNIPPAVPPWQRGKRPLARNSRKDLSQRTLY